MFTRFEDDDPGGSLLLDTVLPGGCILFDDVKGVIVNRENLFGVNELDGAQGIVRSHGEIVSYREDGQVNAFFTDQLHVVKKPGVAGVVDLLALDVEEKAARIATVGPVRKARTMLGDCQFDPSPWVVEPAADVLGVQVLQPLVCEPVVDFEI